jgi:rhodanese-related sulfurtransferase
MPIDDLLTDARASLHRLEPREAKEHMDAGALLIDTRTESQRSEQGELPNAIVVDRTILEWRLDPACESRISEIHGYDHMVIVVCRQGYSSSLAAQSLQRLGLHRATDIIGGVENWIQQGLPLSELPADVRH